MSVLAVDVTLPQNSDYLRTGGQELWPESNCVTGLVPLWQRLDQLRKYSLFFKVSCSLFELCLRLTGTCCGDGRRLSCSDVSSHHSFS